MKKCLLRECEKPRWSNGLCRFHEQRQRNGVPLDAPFRASRSDPKGWVHKGYRWIMADGKEVMEHRHKMKTFLKRDLSYDEIVHHIDEDKLNNDISNLEIKLRGPHTSHHRAHQTPCIICGELDPHGTRGRCSKHHQQYIRNLKKLGSS